MKTNETIYDTYKKQICKNCKNKTTDLCEIRKKIDNTIKCKNYEREKTSMKEIGGIKHEKKMD